jgi:alkaline phosphatase D
MRRHLALFLLFVGLSCEHQEYQYPVEPLLAEDGTLTAGPMLGEVTETGATLWALSSKPQTFTVKLREVDGKWLPTDFELVLSGDNPKGRCQVTGLKPDTEYSYRLISANGSVIEGDSQRFRTFGGDKLRITFGSCAGDWGDDPSQPVFNTLASHNPNLMLWLGDNIYYDRGKKEWESELAMENRWQLQRSLSNLQPFLSSTSHAAIWDDHDYGPNDSDRTYRHREYSLKLFQDYWPQYKYPNPEDGVYHKISLNQVDIFMLDTRFHRDPNDAQGLNKSLLGESQWSWLQQELLSSKAEFKIIVSSMQFLAEYHSYEAWKMFSREKQRLIGVLKAHDVEGVLFLSGDRHFGEVLLDKESLNYPLYEMTASPLAAGVGRGPKDADVPRRVEGTMVSAEHFGQLDFDFSVPDPVLVMRAFGVDGSELGRKVVLSAGELKLNQN